MGIINKILIVIVGLVFLFSSIGLMLIHHVCDTCDVSEILINTKHTHKENHQSEKKCCSEKSCHIDIKQDIKDDSECCSEDRFYLKITEPFLSLAYSFDFDGKVFQLFDYNKIEINDTKLTHQIFHTSIIKPPDLSGRKILRKNCILRV